MRPVVSVELEWFDQVDRLQNGVISAGAVHNQVFSSDHKSPKCPQQLRTELSQFGPQVVRAVVIRAVSQCF